MSYFIADFGRVVKLKRNSSQIGETSRRYTPAQSTINPNMVTGSNVIVVRDVPDNNIRKGLVSHTTLASRKDGTGRSRVNRVNLYGDDGKNFTTYDKKVRYLEDVDLSKVKERPMTDLDNLNKKRRHVKPEPVVKPKLSRKNMLLLGGGLATTGLVGAGLYLHNKNKNNNKGK